MLTIFPTAFDLGFQNKSTHPNPVATGNTEPSPATQAIIPSEDVVDTGSGETQNQSSSNAYGYRNAKTGYAIDLESNEVVIKVVDPESQKELRQIPTEEARALSQRIEKHQEKTFDNL